MWLFGEDQQADLNNNDPSARARLSVANWQEQTPLRFLAESTSHRGSWAASERLSLVDAAKWETVCHERGQITLSDGSTRDGWVAILARIPREEELVRREHGPADLPEALIEIETA
jgi:hypothetical protein